MLLSLAAGKHSAEMGEKQLLKMLLPSSGNYSKNVFEPHAFSAEENPY